MGFFLFFMVFLTLYSSVHLYAFLKVRAALLPGRRLKAQAQVTQGRIMDGYLGCKNRPKYIDEHNDPTDQGDRVTYQLVEKLFP